MLKAIPLGAIEESAQLMDEAEARAVWPWQWHRAIVLLLGKTDRLEFSVDIKSCLAK